MATVVLFNHIPKTAGSTVRYILWRQVGADRVLTSTTLGHKERVAEIAERLEGPLEGDYVVQTHVGHGVADYLPARHSYRAFTFVRDPVERTISRYFYARGQASTLDDGDVSVSEFLETNPVEAFNVQTAFLSGLLSKHYMEGVPMRREEFNSDLLNRAKRNLEAHTVVGITERFDESLLLLRHKFHWSILKSLYRPANVGHDRKVGAAVSETDLRAIEASNELDADLYRFACKLFEERLAELDGHRRRLRRFESLNSAYAGIHPVLQRVRAVALRG